MSHASYPVAADLQAYLASAGFTLDAGQISQLGTAVGAGIAAFEGDVSRKMLADSTAQARTFAPPFPGQPLFLPDFISVSSLTYAPYNSTPQSLALLTDYWLEPEDALQDDLHYQPYNAILFRRQWGQPLYPAQYRGLSITAKWGYAVEIPDDAWQAMLYQGGMQAVSILGVAAFGGLTSWSEADVKEDYGVRPYGGFASFLGEQYAATVRRYRRVSV